MAFSRQWCALVTHTDFSLEPGSVALWSRLVAAPTSVVQHVAGASLVVVHEASGGGGDCNCVGKLSLWQ